MAPLDVTADPDRSWLDGAEEEVWRRLLSVQRRLLARLDDDLREAHDLTLADYDVLVVLSEAPAAALRMGDLAERVALSPSGLTRRVDRLVARGLVRRRSCPSDGRGSLAALTPAGRQVLAEAAPTHVVGVRRYLFDVIGPGELPALTAALDRIAETLAGDLPETLAGGLPERPWPPGPAGCPDEDAPPDGGCEGTEAAGAGPAGGPQAGCGPSAVGCPDAAQPLVPPATDTAR